MLPAAFTLVATSGCVRDAAPAPDPKASVAKLMPGSTACKVFPTDLAIKATSNFPGGLTQGGDSGTRPGSGFICSIEVLRIGTRFNAIEVQLDIGTVDDKFFVSRQSYLQTPPYLTLPTRLGEGYARDNHAALLRRCPQPAGLEERDYIISIGVQATGVPKPQNLGVIPRTDLAKVITDAVPVIDKHLGCIPAATKSP
jgi:hypothetical protein